MGNIWEETRKKLEDTTGVKVAVGNPLGNFAKNVGDVLTETAYAVRTGNYNNFDQTLLKLGSLTVGGGFLPLEDMKLKESNIQRATREAQEAAALQEMEASAAKEKERLRGLADMLTSSANARRMAPGMSQTILGSATGSGGLLVTGS